MDFSVTRDTHRYTPLIYAGASGDFNPIHVDADFAKAVGFERNIIHGLCTMAFVAKAAVDEAGGDPRRLKRLKVRFSRPLLVEQKAIVTGKETERTGSVARLEVEAHNEREEKVISRGVAEVDVG